MSSQPKHIEEPTQGLVPIWKKEFGEQECYRAKLKEAREEYKQKKAHEAEIKSQVMISTIKSVLEDPQQLNELASRLLLDQEKSLFNKDTLHKSPLQDKLAHIIPFLQIDDQTMTVKADIIQKLSDYQKRKLSRLVLNPEQFIR